MSVNLCDFGLARYYIADSSSTVNMTTAGTKNYAAPEIRKNLEKARQDGSGDDDNIEDRTVSKYTESCDIFSAAVVAYELVTGKLEQGNILG